MARSTYIYIVLINRAVYAAFTVKHEMEKYLDDREGLIEEGGVQILRVRDNGDEDPTDITDKYYEET